MSSFIENVTKEYDEQSLFEQAVIFVRETGNTTSSSLQRRFEISFNRAVRIVEQLEAQGIISPVDPQGKRAVLPH